MSRYYVSGPMTGIAHYNHENFARVTSMLRAEGHEVVSPAEHDDELGIKGGTPVDPKTYRELLEWDIDAIRKSTHIYMMQGWEHSRGATLEHALAKLLGLTIEYEAPRDDAQYFYGWGSAIPR